MLLLLVHLIWLVFLILIFSFLCNKGKFSCWPSVLFKVILNPWSCNPAFYVTILESSFYRPVFMSRPSKMVLFLKVWHEESRPLSSQISMGMSHNHFEHWLFHLQKEVTSLCLWGSHLGNFSMTCWSDGKDPICCHFFWEWLSSCMCVCEPYFSGSLNVY